MKKKLYTISIVFLMLTVFAVMFSGCMRIGMQKNNVEKRLSENGYNILYKNTATSYIKTEQQIKTTAIVHASKQVVIEDEGGLEIVDLYIVEVVFCADAKSADIVENSYKAFKPTMGETTGIDKNILIYRYNNVVMIGDYLSVAVARSY